MKRNEKLMKFIQMWEDFEEEMNKEDPNDIPQIGSTGKHPAEDSEK